MRLTWRDGIATLLTAAAVAIFWALQAGFSLPLVASVRGAAAAILLIGVGTCAIGARMYERGRLYTTLGFLGTVAFFAGLVAIIWARESALAVESSVIVFLWAATTIRHALPPPPPTVSAYEPPREHTRVG